MSFLFLSTLVVVLAGLHISEATSDYIEVKRFGVGMSATAVYTAPGDGRTMINLSDANGGVVLHMDYRLRFFHHRKRLTLNSKPAGGRWGTEQHVNNFSYAPGAKVELTAKAKNGYFAIIVNGVLVATYNYRLPVESVKRLQFSIGNGSRSKLVSLTFGF